METRCTHAFTAQNEIIPDSVYVAFASYPPRCGPPSIASPFNVFPLPVDAFEWVPCGTRTRGTGATTIASAWVQIGVLPTGQHNAITDVPGVAVGHQTIVRGESVCTGVTAILPHDGNVFLQKTPAAVHIANGFGKLVGSTQIQELGVIETPILLTNTLSTFLAADALAAWTLAQPDAKKCFR